MVHLRYENTAEQMSQYIFPAARNIWQPWTKHRAPVVAFLSKLNGDLSDIASNPLRHRIVNFRFGFFLLVLGWRMRGTRKVVATSLRLHRYQLYMLVSTYTHLSKFELVDNAGAASQEYKTIIL
jgi:hypothetical protein